MSLRLKPKRLLHGRDLGKAVITPPRRSARTFPYVVQQATTDTGPAGGAALDIHLPNDDLQIGDVLVAFVRETANGGTWTWPTGWTELWDSTADASADSFTGAARVVNFDANEAAKVVPSYSAGFSRTLSGAFQVRGATGIPSGGSIVAATTTNPNPPNLAPGLGAKDFLWCAITSQENNNSISAYPTNYTLYQNYVSAQNAGGNSAVSLAWAFRELNASSEDPGSFTYSGSEDTMTTTLAFEPTT